MADLLVGGVPDAVLAELRARAARRGQSLEAYARGVLEAATVTPVSEEVLRRTGRCATARLSTDAVLAEVDAGRLGR
ncbi:FitA-like ribbon-helix-helix domain-containing protein [Streptomyces pathocidini]|uniref:FitA-like ribbon-helix-helix domain-containing protein n=1 Tax=Streptomyces pathocidini TaxID=1650571 RepID=A0ABW7UW08_9ACTN|nr:hypothetical protein [Streptomyces pathocidini]